LLYKQLTSSLDRKDYLRVISKINFLSKLYVVVVEQRYLDIIFIDDELVSHPLVRYLNDRNNIIFDKIEQFHIYVQDRLFNREDILSLSSYSQEEYIPSLTVDVFFSEDINEVKHKIKSSIQHKALKENLFLILLLNNLFDQVKKLIVCITIQYVLKYNTLKCLDLK
jgi:hypothetical protein